MVEIYSMWIILRKKEGKEGATKGGGREKEGGEEAGKKEGRREEKAL